MSGTFDLRATSGAVSSVLGRYTRQSTPPPVGGDYSGVRYAPRYTLPAGATYNTTTGRVDFVPPQGYLVVANEVLLTDQGSVAANRAALQNAITNSGTDAVRIRLAPVTTSWGDEIEVTGTRVGAGLVIEPASVKDGTFVRAAGHRVQANDTGLAPFRLNPNYAWPSPGGNPSMRQCIRVMPNARNIRLLGLDCTYDPTWAATLLNEGGDGGVWCLMGLIGVLEGTPPTARPADWQIDRCRLVAPYRKYCQRLVRADNSERHTMRDSHLSHTTFGSQGHAWLSTEGGAGWWLLNNYIASGGDANQHILFGGGGDLWNGTGYELARSMTDIVVADNLFDFPDQWHADGLETMCFPELKMGTRALIEANVLRGFRGVGANSNWTAIVLKESTGPLRDVTVRLNQLIECNGFLSKPGGQRVQASHNLMRPYTGPAQTLRSFGLQINDTDGGKAWTQTDEFTLDHNTVQPLKRDDPSFAQGMFEGLQINERRRWRIRNNIIGVQTGAGIPGWHYHMNGGSNARATWESATNIDCEHAGNVYTVNAPAAQRITTNAEDILFPANMEALSFDSTYSCTTPGLTDKGADGVLVASATNRALTGIG